MENTAIGNVWVFIEQEGGKIADVSLELVCKGRELADQLGVKVEALLLGNGVEHCCATLFQYGCDNVFLVGMMFIRSVSAYMRLWHCLFCFSVRQWVYGMY